MPWTRRWPRDRDGSADPLCCRNRLRPDIGTIAGLNVLGEIAKKTAEYGTRLLVPVRDPVVFTVAREITKGAYTEAGHPDTYDPNSV